MKSIIQGMILLGLVTVVAQAATEDDLKDQKKRLGYGLGANYGKILKQNKVDLDIDMEMFIQGLMDYLNETSLMNDTEISSSTQEINKLVGERRKAEQALLAQENLEKGKAFLAENKSKEGVKTLPSGLQYKVIHQGSGKIPNASDRVRVHYKGTYLDGKQFDSSYARGKPAAFSVTGVIRGWTEALQLMHVGSKWQLFVPSDLAYGERGSRSIPANSTLIFDVELLGIEEPPKPKKAAPVTSDIIKVPSAAEMKKGAKIEVIKQDEVDKYIEEKHSKEKKAADK